MSDRTTLLSLMTWNWQQSGWPGFRWEAARLRRAEAQFLLGSGRFAGTIKHLGDAEREPLTMEAICTEALATSPEGRAISEKGLAATILIRQKAYHAVLEAANKENHVTPWLCWFGGIGTEAPVEFLLDKTRLLDRLRGQLNARQEKEALCRRGERRNAR